jgi:hypothetical protein
MRKIFGYKTLYYFLEYRQISGVYLAGESPAAEGVPDPPYSESCVAGGNNSDEA